MKKPQTHAFTLVELMVAMAILVIMMGFLFQFVIGAQRIWHSSSGEAALFEQAQLVFEYMGKDFKNIRSQSPLNEDIYFFYSLSENDRDLGFISEVNGFPIPVTYHYDKSSEKLYRLEIDNSVSTSFHAYLTSNKASSDFLANFELSTSSYNWSHEAPLAEDLYEMNIQGPNNGYSWGNNFPKAIRITLTLVDRTHLDDATYTNIKNDTDKLAPYLHTFTKIFFLK